MTAEYDPAPSSLKAFVAAARWFGGKGREFEVSDVRRMGWLGEGDDGARVRIELATIDYADGGQDFYQLPLVYYAEAQSRLEHALIGAWDDPELGPVYVYDALHDRNATALWLQAFDVSRSDDELVFHRLEGHDLDLTTHSTLLSAEQSNSSVAFGEDCLMKVFRRLTRGRNPDIEIHEALTKAGSDHVAALYGWLEAKAYRAEEPVHLAMLQQFLRTASDGWDLARASVRDLFAEADLHADEVGGDFAGESRRLGVAMAEVHQALVEAFPTESWGSAEISDLADAMTQRLEAAVKDVPELSDHADALRAAFDDLSGVDRPVQAQRVHGDLHLGQTLRTVRGWKIVDFEGEPAKAVAERVRPDSVWRDVAGMLRSFDYAAHVVESDVEEGAQIAYRANEWSERNRGAFLAGYLAARAGEESTLDEGLETVAPPEPDRPLLRAYEADKAVYEVVYEARNRPGWVRIPLAAIERLSERREVTSP